MNANLKQRIVEVRDTAAQRSPSWMDGCSDDMMKLLKKLDRNGDGVLDGSELKQIETLYGGLSEDRTEDFGGRRARGHFNRNRTDHKGFISDRSAHKKIPEPPPPRAPQYRPDSRLGAEIDAVSGRSLAPSEVFPDYSLPKSYANEPGIVGRMQLDGLVRAPSPQSSAGYISNRYSERQRAVQDEVHAEHRMAALHASPRQVEAKLKIQELTEELEELTPRFHDEINLPLGKRIQMKSDARGVDLPRRDDRRSFLQSSDLHGLVRSRWHVFCCALSARLSTSLHLAPKLLHVFLHCDSRGLRLLLRWHDNFVYTTTTWYLIALRRRNFKQCWGNGFHNRNHGWKPPIAVGRRAIAADRFNRPAAGAHNKAFEERMLKQQVIYLRK